MEQRTPEWYAARMGRVTGSRIGPLMGLGSWATREQTLAEMVAEVATGTRKEIAPNAPMQYGTEHEPIALRAYLDYTFRAPSDVADGGFWEHPQNHKFAASPDGIIGDDGGLEIKCPYKYRNGAPDAWTPCIEQPQYYAQVQWCMYVTGRKWWDFFQWAPSGEPHLERVERDEEFIARAVEAAESALAYVADVTAEAVPAGPIGDDGELDIYAIYDRAAAAEAEAKALHDDAKKALAEAIEAIAEQAGERVWPDGERRLVRKTRAGSISYASAIKALAPDADLEPYRGKPSETWSVERLKK